MHVLNLINRHPYPPVTYLKRRRWPTMLLSALAIFSLATVAVYW